MILVRDHKQLPATVKSTVNGDLGRGESLFQRFFETDGIERVILIEQHRMHPEIASYPSTSFYDDRLHSMTAWKTNPAAYEFPSDSPVCSKQCNGREEKRGISFINHSQAERIAEIVLDVNSAWRHIRPAGSVQKGPRTKDQHTPGLCFEQCSCCVLLPVFFFRSIPKGTPI